MTRTILLGLLTIAIIPVTFANAIATSNTEMNFAPPPNQKTDLDLDCIPPKTLGNCSSSPTSSVNSLKSSQVWLEDIAAILLSGSMFSGCRAKTNHKTDFSPNFSDKPLQNTIIPGCIFPWQNYPKNKLEIQDTKQILATDSSNIINSSDSLTRATVTSKSPQKFPKISRSSLIVDFPTADSTFKPKNSKLANPAPKTKRIASPFGWRRRPYSYQLQFHQGIDYGAPLGSPVVAVGDGIVTKVVSGCYDFGNLFCGGQLGNWIEIDHGNGAIGIYGHLKNSSITIEEGMKVWKNQEIAQVGSSGWSTGAHLDFRLKIDGEYEDPDKYLTPPSL